MLERKATNQQTDNSVKCKLDADRVPTADVCNKSDVHSNPPDGPAKRVSDELGMDGDDRSVRRAIDCFVLRQYLTPFD